MPTSTSYRPACLSTTVPRLMAPLLCALALAACSPTHVLNQLTPSAGFSLKTDLAYGTEPRQKTDLYHPAPGIPVQHDVVVFIHGGGWDSGDKAQYLFVAEAFTSLGYVTAIPGYRLYPQVGFPDFVDDVARAIAALPDHLPLTGCADTRRLILVGHSAGAHTAALLATDTGYFKRHGVDAEVRALIGLAGPYDLDLDDPAVVGKFDERRNDRETNPVELAESKAPITLLIHGAADQTVGLHHSQRLAAKLRQLGVEVTFKVYPDTDHKFVVGALARPLRFLNPVYADIEQFLSHSASIQGCRAD